MKSDDGTEVEGKYTTQYKLRQSTSEIVMTAPAFCIPFEQLHKILTQTRCKAKPNVSPPGCLHRATVLWIKPTKIGCHGNVPCRIKKLISHIYSHVAFSVLTRLGGRNGIRPVKNWVVGCWHGYLSGARCRLAYGPADATATHCLLLQ